MPKEYKTLYFDDTEAGREKLTAKINELAKDGWELKSKETTSQGWNIGKTFWLGFLFLPLALRGKKKNLIQVVMERERTTKEMSGKAGEKDDTYDGRTQDRSFRLTK